MAFLLDCWESYRKDVVPADASAEQLIETRRAFYAGAHSVLQFLDCASRDEVSEDAAVYALAEIEAEVLVFGEGVRAGKF